MPPASNELRASVLDAALQLGLMRDDRFAEWIFDDRVVTPDPGSGEVDKRKGEEVLQEDSVLGGGDRMAGDMSSANSSSASLNLQVQQLEEAYSALASMRLTRAATRKGGRTGPSHQASQSEVLSFSRQDAVAGSSSTLARSATFSSRTPATLHIDAAKSNAPFITVTHEDNDEPEVSYVSTIWGKELLQSYDIELTSAPPTPVSNSPLSTGGPPLPLTSSSQSSLHVQPPQMPPLLSASPTDASFTSSDISSLHTPAQVPIPPPRRIPPPAISIPSEGTTPRLPPTPPLVVKKHHPTSAGSGQFVPITPSSSISQLSSPPPTPYSAASPDSPTLPWTKSRTTIASASADQLGDKTSSRNKPSKPLPAPNSTPPSPSQSPYTSLFSRLSFRRKSKNSVTSDLSSPRSGKVLPPIPPSSYPSPSYPPSSSSSSRTVNAKALSTPPPKTMTRVPITISHVSMDALKSSTLSPSPISPSPKQQIRGRISPFPVRPVRRQPLSPSASTLPSPASPAPAS